MKILKKDILKLKPTQYCVGFEEVDSKVQKLLKMTAKQRRKHQEGKTIPVVIGPGKEFYMVDHHHAARACWEAGVKKVNVVVIADFSKMSVYKFWRTMTVKGWVYPWILGTKLPWQFETLPQDIRGMLDDPYRSLAWAVKEAGGFAKSEVPFFEFAWANLFRNKIEPKLVRNNFELATRKAIKIAKKK